MRDFNLFINQLPLGVNFVAEQPSGVLIITFHASHYFNTLHQSGYPSFTTPYLYLLPGELQPSGHITYTFQSNITYRNRPASYLGVYFIVNRVFHIALTSFDTQFIHFTSQPSRIFVSHHFTSEDLASYLNVSAVDYSLLSLPSTDLRVLLPPAPTSSEVSLESLNLSQYRPLSNFIPVLHLSELYRLFSSVLDTFVL